MLQSMAVAEQGCEPQHDPCSEQQPMVAESGHVGPSPAGPAGETPSQPSAPARRAQRPQRAGGCSPPASTHSRGLGRPLKTHLQPYHRSHGRHSRKSVLEKAQQMCNKLIWLHVTSPVPASSPVGYMEIPPVKPTFLGTSPVVGWPLAFRVPQVPQLWQGSQAPRQSHLTCVRAQS